MTNDEKIVQIGTLAKAAAVASQDLPRLVGEVMRDICEAAAIATLRYSASVPCGIGITLFYPNDNPIKSVPRMDYQRDGAFWRSNSGCDPDLSTALVMAEALRNGLLDKVIENIERYHMELAAGHATLNHLKAAFNMQQAGINIEVTVRKSG